MWPFLESNKVIVTAKRAQRDEALTGIPQSATAQSGFTKATGALTTTSESKRLDDDFLNAVAEIVSRIERFEWTATQVLEAYISRAAFAHAKTNCLTEGIFLTRIPYFSRGLMHFIMCSYVGTC
jgi:amidase